MARGTGRAPSQHAYRGKLGRTQESAIHVATPQGELVPARVHTTIDAVSHPELVERLHADELHAIKLESGDTVRVSVPVVYHDPAAEVLVLVLAEAHRHRELDERIRILEAMRADDAPIPPYAKDFVVVYGGAGLRDYLEKRAQAALSAGDRTRLERETELDKRTRELDRRTVELDRRTVELDALKAELERSRTEVERLRSEARNRVIAQAQTASREEARPAARADAEPPWLPPPTEDSVATVIGPPPHRDVEVATSPIPKTTIDELGAGPAPAPRAVDDAWTSSHAKQELTIDSGLLTGVVDALDALDRPPDPDKGEVDVNPFEEEPTGSSIIPQGSDPLTTETEELSADGATDPWVDKATSTFLIDASGVRLALVASEQVARELGSALDVRVLLHRVATYPVISLVIGSPAALRVPTTSQLAVVVLDIASDRDRQVLAALGRRFELTIDLIVHRKRTRRVKIVAPLGDNIGYIMHAAEDHLRGLVSDASTEGDVSLQRARDLVLGPGFDLLGVEQSDAAEFRDDKLAQLETAQQLRRAIAIARRFARPSREDYLVCTRGFPLPRWRELRRHVLDSAVTWGLWMGPELAQVAVSEGLARSRRDLVQKLDRGFEALRRHPTAFDLDEEASADNVKQLADEARALGVELARPLPDGSKNGTIASDEGVSSVSGSIGGTGPHGIIRQKTVDELIALLADKRQRVDAALQLCERAEARAAGPVIAAVASMSRAEAVRVLGMSVKFGAAAKGPLAHGLASNKAFLRHGCALALALLRTEDGTQAVIELLLDEPTEIWREVARAIGQVGPSALLPLASTFGKLGERSTPAMAERVAWAMAHVAVRGGKHAIETMAGGQSVVAPVARQALELHGSAAKDHVRVRPNADGSQPGRDITVNRAFSRRFFEALEQGLPEAGQQGLVDLDVSGPMELLDESDLIEEEEEAEQLLDDSDLIQT